MKILLVARDKWGYSGGIEQYLITLTKSLSQFGHKIVVMYAKKGNRPIKEKLPIYAEYQIPSLDEYPSFHNIKDVKKVLKVIEEEDVDIVYIREMKNYAILKALITHKPTIARLHGCIITCLRHGTKTLYMSRQICERKLGLGCYLHGCFLSKPLKGEIWPRFNNIVHAQRRLQVYRQLEKIIVASQYIKTELIKNGFQEQQVIVLSHNPAEIAEIEEKDLNYKKNTLLFVGRIDRYKGVDVLLKALTFVLHDFKAWIIGEGPYLEKCKHICKKFGLENKVKFLGWIPNNELCNFYLKTRLVVVPSIWPEPFGRVGIEAMAYSRPVVAFDVGGISTWLKDGETGFLVKRMDCQGMADKITLLLNNSLLARQMGLNGHKRYLAKFSNTDYIKRLTEIFQSIIESKIKN